GLTQTAPSGNTANANVAIVMPKGVSVKSAGAGVKSVTATSISVSVTAADIATVITATVPLSTLSVSFDVPSGSARTFTVTVVTSSGSYTGSQTVDLAGGASVNLSISVTTSTTTTTTTTTTAPSAPSGVSVALGNARATLTWTAPPPPVTVTSYNVYYKTSAGVTIGGAGVTKSAGATSGGAITGLTNGTTYYFVVTAVNSGSESVVSAEVSAKPANLLGGGVENGGVAINNSSTGSTIMVSTLAGLALTAGTTDATGSGARFGRPYGITTDGTNLYVADQTNNTIRKVVMSTGVVTTIAGSGAAGSVDGVGTGASFNGPTGIATDGTNLFITDRTGNTVRKVVLSTGVVSTVAGSGATGSADGTGTAATFSSPNGIVTDGKKVVISTGVVTTLAGSGVAGSADGTGTAANFKLPDGITTDGTNLFIDDNNNYTIRKVVISTGVTTTLAGTPLITGSTDGSGSAALFNFPTGITTDGSNLYVADGSNKTVRKIFPLLGGTFQGGSLGLGGVVTTFAGGAGVFGTTDGTGTGARFSFPYGLTTDGTNLYVADTTNNTIRQVVIATGVVTTLAGSGTALGTTDGTGTGARFYLPNGITTDGTNVYVADTYNHTIRKVVIATGVVTTLAGSGTALGTADGTGTAARFNHPQGITTDGTNVYVADTYNQTIRKVVIATGVVTTLAGSAAIGTIDGTGTGARFYLPRGLTTDGTNLYVVDCANHTIRQIVISTGVVTTLAGGAGVTGTTDGTGTAARFNYPEGITTDGTNLYVADTTNNTIRQVVIATGVVTTLAGGAGLTGTTDGTGTAARFYLPSGLTSDGTNLYVADSSNNNIRKIK
ncbi:MAG: fibronectin type III domain-containing protein, partial [Nitrospinae bacterium]|nr:fibronectin type III domain-containing protein [Nitrospinota bacterium]